MKFRPHLFGIGAAGQIGWFAQSQRVQQRGVEARIAVVIKLNVRRVGLVGVECDRDLLLAGRKRESPLKNFAMSAE